MAAEWDQCEDCFGTGGHRDSYGEGQCGNCGGRGRVPANGAAIAQLTRDETKRQQAIERMVTREYDY